MFECESCLHDGYCIPDDCGQLTKKEPPPTNADCDSTNNSLAYNSMTGSKKSMKGITINVNVNGTIRLLILAQKGR